MSYITKQRVYELIKEAAIYAPAGESQPKTFAVIDSLQDFNLENLGFIAADLNGADLWSRGSKTANNFSLDYPMCCIIPMAVDVSERVNYSVRIMYVDRVHREKIADGTRKTDSEILDNAVEFMVNLTQYMSGVVRHQVLFNDTSEHTDYYNTGLLEYLLNNENISDFNTTGAPAYNNQYNMDVAEPFSSFKLNYMTYPVTEDLIIGGWAEFNFSIVNCSEPEFDYYFSGDYGKSKKIYAGK